MKHIEAIINVIIVLLFIFPLVSLYFDFENSLHDGIETLAFLIFLTIVVVLKRKYSNK